MKIKLSLAIFFSFLTTNIYCNQYQNAVLANNINKLYAITKQNLTGINKKAKNGSTPLHLASELNNKEMVQFLIDNGTNRFLTNNKGEIPLHIAAKTCSLSVMKIIIFCWPHKIDMQRYLNTKDTNGNTFLHLICQRTDIPNDFIKKLLDLGADRSLTNKNGQKAQDIAKNTFNKMAIESQSLFSSPEEKNMFEIINHLLNNNQNINFK